MLRALPLPGVLPTVSRGDLLRVPDPESAVGATMLDRAQGPVEADANNNWCVPMLVAGLVPVGLAEKI